eukprot:9506245-Lingulodinium_polyedra.AAC.1
MGAHRSSAGAPHSNMGTHCSSAGAPHSNRPPPLTTIDLWEGCSSPARVVLPCCSSPSPT